MENPGPSPPPPPFALSGPRVRSRKRMGSTKAMDLVQLHLRGKCEGGIAPVPAFWLPGASAFTRGGGGGSHARQPYAVGGGGGAKKGGWFAMAWEGALFHLQNVLIFSNFHKGFFVVWQGGRVLLCRHRAAGLFELPQSYVLLWCFIVCHFKGGHLPL